MGTPLSVEGRILGVVVVQSYEGGSNFEESDLDVLNYIAEQIAIAIRTKQAEEALQIEKNYFLELFRSSPEAVALASKDSTILRVNQEFEHLFQFSRDEAVGQSIDELITDQWQRAEAQETTDQVAGGEKI